MSATKEYKENKSCPSYDCEICTTYPTPYSVKCKSIEKCQWKETNFNEAGLYEKFLKNWDEKHGRKKKK